MKAIRKILTFLFLAMAALMLVGLSLPPDWSTERSVLIRAAPAEVFPWVADLQKWKDWAVWFEHDPAMQTTFSDPSTGAGAHYEWSGNPSVGEGRVEVDEVLPDRKVGLRLAMSDETFQAAGEIELEPAIDGTRVTWRLGGQLGKDPFARLNRALLQNAVGGTLQANLDRLKQIAEQASPSP